MDKNKSSIRGVQFLDVLEDTSGGEIESVLNDDSGLTQVVKDEAFMNEVVVVHAHASTNENDPPHFILSVNGTNQPVFRGQNTPMKRKYLEVLARMKTTNFTQPPRDNMNPEPGNALIPHTGMVYPFQVIEDKNPRGPAWLSAILQENV